MAQQAQPSSWPHQWTMYWLLFPSHFLFLHQDFLESLYRLNSCPRACFWDRVLALIICLFPWPWTKHLFPVFLSQSMEQVQESHRSAVWYEYLCLQWWKENGECWQRTAFSYFSTLLLTEKLVMEWTRVLTHSPASQIGRKPITRASSGTFPHEFCLWVTVILPTHFPHLQVIFLFPEPNFKGLKQFSYFIPQCSTLWVAPGCAAVTESVW